MTLQELIVRGQREALPIGALQDLALRASKEGFQLPYADEALGVLRRHKDVAIEGSRAIIARAQREKRELLASEQRDVDKAHGDAREINKLMALVGAARAEHAYTGPPTERGVGQDGHTEARGFLPSTTEYRAMGSSGTDALGGYLVPEQHSALFFDRLRAQSVVLQIPGLRVLPMDSLELNVPGLAASATAAFVGEHAEITGSDLTLTSRKLTARKLAARVLASNEWLTDATPSARLIVEQDLIRTMATTLDLALLEGTGAGADPIGLRRFTGPTVTTLGSGSGAVITLDDIADAIERMKTSNAVPTAIVCHPRTEAQVRLLKDGDGHYIWQPSIAENAPPRLFGLPLLVSSQISVTENVGGATKSWLAVVDGSQLVVGQRQTVRIFYDPFSRSSYGQTQIIAASRWDVALLNAAGVEIVAGLAAS